MGQQAVRDEVSEDQLPEAEPRSLRPQRLDGPFQQLLESLPVGAYTCDAAGQITYYNPQIEKMWGRTPRLNDPADLWCGSFKLFSAVDGSPVPHDQCWMALTIKTGQPHNGYEIVVERRDGLRFTVLAHSNPIRDHAGRLVGAVNVVVDISDRKRGEEAQSRLGAIVESSDDAIISKTLEGRIISWNAGAQRIFGYSQDEAVGKPITLIIPPELHDEERDILATLCRGERVDHYETIRMAKDGRRLNISISSSPVRDSLGRIIGASKVARDITARKRDEEALLLLQAMSVRLSTALDLDFIMNETLRTTAAIQRTRVGVLWVADESGQQLQVGASLGLDEERIGELARLEAAEGSAARCFVEGRRVTIPDLRSDPAAESRRGAAETAGVRAVDSTPLVTRSGAVLGVLSTFSEYPGGPSETEKSLVDVCARQAVDFIENARLYRELREADRTKNEFLATLAHELRNPLAPIRNTVETLHLTAASTPELRSALGVIDRQLSQMTRLIDDLLDISRITKNKLELRRERIDLADVLHAAVESSRPLLTARGHDFGVDLPPEPLWLDADMARLAQVVSNLLNNAAKYTARGGRVRLTARRQGSEAVISVRDTGIGIAPETFGRIFEMFAQVDRSLDRSEGGLGIGLHLAKRLVEMHGGTLTATSEGIGEGSEFTVRLPIPAGAVQPTRNRTDANIHSGIPASSLRILVVDDNRDSADSLGLLLQIPGNRVHIAYDGLHAVEMAAEFRPDVVLLDIGLPKLNGYEAAERIRAEGWGRDMTLIALTGWGQEEAKQRSHEAGFDAHLVKPVDPTMLMRQLAFIKRKAES